MVVRTLISFPLLCTFACLFGTAVNVLSVESRDHGIYAKVWYNAAGLIYNGYTDLDMEWVSVYHIMV